MNTLHYIPAPHPNESPTSLLRRIALNNGFSTVPRFCTRTKLKLGFGLLLQNSKFHTLLERENPRIDYRTTFYKRASSKFARLVDIGGCQVPMAEMNCLTSGICTECIRRGWEHKVKDIRCAEYCPIHFSRYLRSCPYCHKRFTSFNQLSLTCTCGAHLSCKIGTADTAEVEISLLSILDHHDQAALDKFFYALNKLKYRTSTYHHELSRTLVNCAMDIALGNITKAYNRLNSSIYYSNPLSHSIIKAQLLYASRATTLPASLNPLATSQPENTGKLKGITFSTKELRTGLALPYSYWLSHAFSFFRKSTRGRYTIEDLMDIKKLYEEIDNKAKKELSTCISASQAREILDTPKQIFTEIYRTGHLTKLYNFSRTSIAISRNSFDAFHNRYISIWAINKILDYTIKSIQNAIKETGTKYLSFLDVDVPCFIERTSLSRLEKHLKRPELKPDNSLERDLINALTVTTFNIPRTSQLITTKEACQRLDLPRGKLYLLINSGIFKTYKVAGRHMLEPKLIAIFKRDFTTLDALEKNTGLHKSFIKTVLFAHKAKTTTLRNRSDTICIYKKSEIKEINLLDARNSSLGFIYHKHNHTVITYKQASNILKLGKYEASILSRAIIQKRPFAYQSRYYNVALTPTEFQELQDIIANSVNLEEVAAKHGMPSQRVLQLFKIKKTKKVIYLNKVTHISKALALSIDNYFNNYVSIITTAELLHTTTRSIYEILKTHPDKNPYLQSTPSAKCVSAGHLDFLSKLIRGLPADFSGPSKTN